MTATDKTLDLEGKEHLEWHGCDLPVVQAFKRTSRPVCTELAAYKRARPVRAGPTMEAQVAGRVMADMFDDGSMFLASFVLLDMGQRSGISKHELRLPGVQSCGCCQMTATDETLDLAGKNILSGMVVTYKFASIQKNF